MKRISLCTLVAIVPFCLVIAGFSSPAVSSNPESAPLVRPVQGSQVAQYMDVTPLAFTENQGQWDKSVRFRADAGGTFIWLTSDGTYYHFIRTIPDEEAGGVGSLSRTPQKTEQILIKASLEGAKPHPEFIGEGLMGHNCNFFLGNNPDKWYTDVPNYRAVVLKEVYTGIDLKYYGSGGLLEYDFILSPGADPSQIEVCYEGAKSVTVDDYGQLVVETDWCTVTERTPLIYQQCSDGEYELEGKYVLLSENTFGFQIGDLYDDAYAVVIDPVLTYGTYIGGIGSDYANDLAIDGSGNMIISGSAYSTDFPTVNPYQTDQPGQDIFVAKFSNAGDVLLYSTYLGGDDHDSPWGLDADSEGNAYVAGQSSSTDYPTVNPYMTDQPYFDVVVTKLNPYGNGLVFSTYLGGSSYEYDGCVAVGIDGAVYVAGQTPSRDFPLINSYDTVGGKCVFVSKFYSDGSGLEYSSVIDGDMRESPYDIAVDAAGCAYIVGSVESSDYPTTPGAFQTDQPGWDGFVTKLSPDGGSLVYSTYIGGNGDDEKPEKLALHPSGELYITGKTPSTDFPTVNAFQTDQPDYDGFVVRLNTSGYPIYSTYLGGDQYDAAYGIEVDSAGNAYVTGLTNSPSTFPLENAFDSIGPSSQGFVTKFDVSGSSLIYSSFFGRASGYDIALDGNGYVVIAGGTSSSNDLPVPNGWDTTYSGDGSDDAFVIKIKDADYIVGDADGSGGVDIDDVVYLIAYIFSGGPEPVPYEAGDADCSGTIDIDDVVYLIAYIFSGGPEPGDPDEDGVPDC